MYSLNGFCLVSSLADNTKYQTSPIGELAPESRTYARDKRYYRGRGTDIELVVFDSTRDQVDEEPQIQYTDITTEVLQWIFEQAIADDFSESEEQCRERIQTNFTSVIRNVTTGPMVNVEGSWFPSWITFIVEGQEENQIKVWLSDASFQYQYTGWYIVPVGPITNIDIFQKTKPQVLEALTEFTTPKHNEKINQLIDGYPCTQFISTEYTWHDREEEASTTPTVWSVIIYGIAGSNPTRRKRALQDYILANSNYPRTDWVKVFPEIFTSTEFTFIPFWERVNGENETDQGSLYSPVIPYEKFKEKASWFFETVENASGTDINNLENRNLDFIPVHYKSLGCLLISGENNPVDKQILTEIYKDYAMIPVSSNQLSRLSKKTTEFIRRLITAMGYAESLYDFMAIDHDYSIIEVNGHQFYTFEHEHVEFRVYIHPDSQEGVVS